MIPASIRNRNPGAQYPGKSSKKFGSTSFETLRSDDGVHKIATFPTHVHGAAALFDLLDRSYTGKTVEQAITKWCGGYYVSTYLQVLNKRANIPPNLEVTKAFLRDHARSVPLARAIAWQEAGREYSDLTEQEWIEAHAMCFAGGKVAPEFSPMNDVPSPKPETRAMEVAKTVGKIVGAVAVGGGGAAVTTTQTTAPVVSIPPPPDISALTGWQSVIKTGKDLALWGAQSWPWVAAAVAVYCGLAYGLPWLQEKRS